MLDKETVLPKTFIIFFCSSFLYIFSLNNAYFSYETNTEFSEQKGTFDMICSVSSFYRFGKEFTKVSHLTEPSSPERTFCCTIQLFVSVSRSSSP